MKLASKRAATLGASRGDAAPQVFTALENAP